MVSPIYAPVATDDDDNKDKAYRRHGANDAQEQAKKKNMVAILACFMVFTSSRFFFGSTSFNLEATGPTKGNDVVDDNRLAELAAVPPDAYPWYYPPPNSDKSRGRSHNQATALLEKFAEAIENVEYEDMNPDGFETVKRKEDPAQVVAYIVRNGTLFAPREQRDANSATNTIYHIMRVQQTEDMIQEALRIGKLVAGRDRRIAKVVDDAEGGFPFLFQFFDHAACGPSGGEEWPRFAYAMRSKPDTCSVFALPAYSHWEQYKKLHSPDDWDVRFEAEEKKVPWGQKVAIAGWRGSTTGFIERYGSTWRDLPRAKIALASKDHPEVIDAGFRGKQNSGLMQLTAEDGAEMKDEGLFGDFVDFDQWKAVIDVDGNSWSERFGSLLCKNSVVLKVQPDDEDYFFHNELKAWKHYVPVNGNLSNLVEVARYAVDPENDEEMRGIVREGNRWCRNKMTSTQLAIDTLWILVSYVELLDSVDPEWREKWRKDPVAYGETVELTDILD